MTTRSTLIAAVLVMAVGLTASVLSAGAPAAPASGPATKVGSVSGKVVGKDGKPAVGANVRFAAATTAPATATAPGGRGGRGGRGGGRGATTPTDDKGAFTLKDVPVGQVNITASLMAEDGTRQTGTTATPVEVKEGQETKLTAEIKLADAPARGGRGPGGPGAGN